MSDAQSIAVRLSAALDGMDKPRKPDARSADLTNPTSQLSMAHADWSADFFDDDATSSSEPPP